MPIIDDSEDAAQNDAEGGDKPPHRSPTANPESITARMHTLTVSSSSSASTVKPNGATPTPTNMHINTDTAPKLYPGGAYPLPPPDTLTSPDKQPGSTRSELMRAEVASNGGLPPLSTVALGAPGKKYVHQHPPQAQTPSQPSSPAIVSPTQSDWGGISAPPSRPPSQPPSRHPSMSAGVSGNKILQPVTPSAKSPKKASSVHSDAGEKSHKFNLKDLLASTPKLSRKSSQRSTSSRMSDSDAGDMGYQSGGGGKARSTGGDSAVSLTQKYGVCQKVAIGKGATSVVRLAHKWDRSEEKLYAVKEFRKRRKNESEKEYVKKLTAEFCISSTLHHPNIVETVDLVQDENQHWCEVMEFCPGGDLYAAIKKGGMSPSEVECCFKQILNGVSYLHSQGVAHRDIKPENLFFDTKGHLKIGDYGASTVYRLPWEATVHMSTGLCGSEPYIAPEQFLGKPYDARLVDIWACGIVYYCLHFQELPWRAAQPATDPLYQTYAAACASSNPTVSACPPTINNLSPRACRTLIRKMLEPDPRQRSTIEEVVAHSWVKGIEVCHEVGEPKHVHVSARALGLAYLRNGE